MAGWLRRAGGLSLGLASLLLLEDALVSWVAGVPARAWGLLPLSDMRLGSFLGLGVGLGAAAWLCALGWPQTERARAGLAACLVFALFLGNGRYIGSNDTAATRSIPFLLAREGRLCFERSAQVKLDAVALPYWFVPAGEHVVSRYPVATGVIAGAFYLPALLGTYDPTRERLQELERIAAAALALLSVMLVGRIARRWLEPSQAGLVALVYAFGTSVSSILSKALWQHVGGAFGFSVALAGLLLARGSAARVWSIGLGCGLAVAARSTNALPAACLIAAAAFVDRPRIALLSASAAVLPVAAQLVYSRYYFGSWLGHGYGAEASTGWSAPWGVGSLGLLLSPGRGIFVYSPCLAFAVVALVRGGEGLDRRASRMLALGVLGLVLVMGKWWCWWGGRSTGDRMLSDVLPFLGVGLALACKQFASDPRWRRPWILSCAYACAVYTLIVFVRPGPETTQSFVNVLSGAWHPRAYAPLAYLVDLLGRG